MRKRDWNERHFDRWENLGSGGRRYVTRGFGRSFGWAEYVKEADAREKTVRFTQNVYNNDGRLIETHQKYPEDTGHRYLEEEL